MNFIDVYEIEKIFEKNIIKMNSKLKRKSSVLNKRNSVFSL